jgi:hypothetical protein
MGHPRTVRAAGCLADCQSATQQIGNLRYLGHARRYINKDLNQPQNPLNQN